MTIAQLLAEAARRFAGAGIDGGARDAQLLLSHAMGVSLMHLTLEGRAEVDSDHHAVFETYVFRRLAHEPVSRILGTRQFWGRDFVVTPDVLDPRPETETLIAAALEGPVPTRLLDLGTGSGIIATTLLAEWQTASGVATDISREALAVARGNAERQEVGPRLETVLSNWYDGVEGRFDLILSNPPYIAADEMADLSPEVRHFDPHLALTPGGDGLDPYRQIARSAPAHLTPGGRVIVEIGPTQGAAVAGFFDLAGLTEIEIRPDLDGRDRIVQAVFAVS